MTPSEFSKLVEACAKAMDDEDKRRIDAGEEHWRAVAGEPSAIGRELCDKIATEMYLRPFGEVAYLLLSCAWNDALDWASRT